MNSIFHLKLFFKIWVSLYVVIFGFPSVLGHIPYLNFFVLKYIQALIDRFTTHIGRLIFGIPDLFRPEFNGSGDTTFGYVELLSILILSFILAVFAVVFLRKKPWMGKVYAWAMIFARYYVGLLLISYGINKLGQFPSPGIGMLEHTYGESSPMGLAWRFLGYSDTYKIFMGLSEMIAGTLLLFRRTAVLGALVSIAVTINIVLVNFSFDVPVKILSSHLMFFSILILLPSIKVLLDFFLFQKHAILTNPVRIWKTKRQRRLWMAAKIYYAFFIPFTMLSSNLWMWSKERNTNEWDGVYTFTQNNLPDSVGIYWSRVVIDKQGLKVETSGENNHSYLIQEVKDGGELYFVSALKQEIPFKLTIKEAAENKYQLQVEMKNRQIDISATRKKKMDYLLMNRGFNWINESPFNR